MLRITTEHNPETLTLRLEGRLEGPWVDVLARSFRKGTARTQGRSLCVDLSGVTFVDAKGKAELARLYASGATLHSDDIENKAIVDECQRTWTREQLAQLQVLRAELHEVNQQLAEAARPLDRLADMNGEQRQYLSKELRAKLARWESVTKQISSVLGTSSDRGQ